MDWSVLWQYRAAILEGLAYTIVISLLAIVGSFLLGTLLGCLRVTGHTILNEVINGYVELVRNIPLIVKLFFLYYIAGFDAFPSGLLALVIHQSGYIADVITAGFRSIHAEQAEAGYAQGLTHWQIFIYALLPQVTRITLPPLTSQFIEVIKNSAVVMFVGVQELTFATQEISQMTLRSFEAATVATILYGGLALAIVGGMSRISHRLSWAQAR
jgi:His/Glu/Gln/Arg/opine family amino acid ABC transporter permease subunit